MQYNKLKCMPNGYCPFKMDLNANMQSQKVKMQCSMQNEKMKAKFLQCMDLYAKMTKNRDLKCNIIR